MVDGLLALSGVTRRFGGLVALDEVALTVQRGQIVGLIGPNGAGKTTLMNCISGLDHPDTGTIRFAGHDITRARPDAIARQGIARTFQNIRLFGEMTPEENLIAAQTARGQSSFISGLLALPSFRAENARFAKRAEHLSERFDLPATPAAALPYGAQRRLEIARALATDPQLLLLDEPTAGMNPLETRDIGETILQLRDEDNLAVLVIEHDMSLINQVCDGVYVLNFGQIIAQGTPAEIRTDERVIEAYLGRRNT